MLKKRLVVLLLMVMTVGVYAQSIPSGTGRIEALGNSPYVLDAATDIFNNPVWANYYRNYAFGDIGRNVVSDFQLDGQYAGVSFGVTKKIALGLVVNKRSDSWGSFRNDTTFGVNGVKDPIVPTMVLFSYGLSKDFYIGLAPYVAMWSSEFTATNVSDKRSSTSLGASLGVMKMVKKGWVEGVVNFRMNSYKIEQTNTGVSTTYKSEGGMQLGVGLRGWIYPKTGSKIALVPVAGFNMYSWNPRFTTTGLDSTGAKYSLLGFNVGVGLNWPVADDIQIAGGIGMNYSSNKREIGGSTFTETHFVAPTFNFAGETRIADWLTGRFGFSRSVDKFKFEDVQSGGTASYTETGTSADVNTVSIGTGFHFGRFSIDATVSEKWLKQGINFVSGQNNDLFGVVSASYNFSTK